MAFLKKAEKILRKHPVLTSVVAQSPFGGEGIGTLADFLAKERKQHEMHEKVKEIHHHYHDEERD